MSLQRKSIAALIILGATAQSMAAYAAENSHKSHAHSHTEFVKPGAAVSMTHDYDGQTNLGEIETVTATLEHIYESGFLTVSVKSGEAIDMMSDTNARHLSLTPESKLAVPIQFSSRQNGQHFIGIDIIYESPDMAQTRRTLSVPIIVGAVPNEKAALKIHYAKAKSSSGLISMNAQEEIK